MCKCQVFFKNYFKNVIIQAKLLKYGFFSPTISLFLMELEKSAEALQDYGVLVGKVTCKKEPVQAYCTDAKQQHRAFLFRGGKEFLSFSLDTVFDVNSIVAEVLFAILRDEVKYVHTDADLLTLEKAAKGKKDIVLGHVRSLGTQEHRSLMETAYVYGSKYQFILITGGPVLKQLGYVLFFFSCESSIIVKVAVHTRCPLTRMRTALSTLSLHTFLQLMEAPLVVFTSEVFIDPSAVPLPQFPYQLTPQVFLFSHPATEHLDLDTAGALAWRLRGLALLLLVHRCAEPTGFKNIPHVKYLTLHSLDDVLELFTKQQEEEEEEEEEEEDSHSGELDDEVAAEVYRNRGHFLDLDLVTQLTSDNFHSEVAQSSLTVPELTVENLPSFLSLGKALLLLFVGEEEDEIGQRQNQALVDQMRGLYSVCFSGRTPAGLSVLGSYLGSLPPLPALVLTHLPSGDEVYQYPPNTPILAGSVLQWLQSVEDGTESPAGMLGGDSWPPAFEFYDFLKVMDMQEGDHRPPEEEEVKTEEVNVEEHLVTKTMPYDRLDMNSKFHSEL
uniref:Thioredoxin domain containing 16 n=1 Tax=Xiphophorus maculatus TaxID=8083 RepID=A0A3B5R6P8_XIPMA